MQGGEYLSPRLIEIKEKCESYKKRMRAKSSPLSSTELNVLKYIAKGLSSKEIAEEMYVSENTIESHRKSLFVKLEAANVAHLVAIAIRQRLIE